MKKQIMAVIAIIALFATALIVMGATQEASATESCVPSEAWTETIEHPEVSHTETITIIDEAAWTETIVDEEAHWQRYSWTGGPHGSDSPPAFPSDDWQPNVKGDPHDIGVEGAYFRSNGNSGRGDWFYLEWVEAVTHTIEHPAVTHDETVTVVDEEAWTEVIEHPAVTCPPDEEEPPVDEEEPPVDEEEPPVDEEEPPVDKEEPPVDKEEPTPPTDKPDARPTADVSCLGGALVVKTTDADGNSFTSTVNGHPRCASTSRVVVKEEGL